MMIDGRWAKPVIDGALVTLRPFTTNDLPALWEMMEDPEGKDLTATTESMDHETMERWYRTRNDQDNRLDLAVVENLTGELAGEVVLNEFDAEANSASIRISLRGPAWFGRGLGSEATGLIVDHGFTTVGLRYITLEVLARNLRAVRAYQKTGFGETSRFTEDGEDWIEMRIDRP